MNDIKNKYKDIFDTFSGIEIEEHIKKLIELDYYYPNMSTFFCITNTVDQSFEYISKNFTACTGIDKQKMMDGGMDFFWSLFHEEDIKLWLECLQSLMHFTMVELPEEKRSKMSYTWNYRIKKGAGGYVNIIQNTTPMQFDQSGKPVIGLAHYTVFDDSIYMDICASAKFLNENNEYETLFFKNMSTKNLLGAVTNRERDVIRLLLLNLNSDEIAEKLFLSKHTIDTHRRNILKKFSIGSTGELISFFKQNVNLI
ncbi:response regulator transcription factor [Flavicella sediminum]|uniref:response regulator transcription factor n=1 Tax=Flavicella sediminum TaxID=2585141 RepID=UPI00111DE16D|nr:helix-turn-helix transcriptional regulator [Flavicella sediminum]